MIHLGAWCCTCCGHQAHWTKARRTRYLDLLDTIQTDEHYGRVAQIAEQLANLATPNNLDQVGTGRVRQVVIPCRMDAEYGTIYGGVYEWSEVGDHGAGTNVA